MDENTADKGTAPVRNKQDEFLLILRETLDLVAANARNATGKDQWDNASLLMLRYSAVVESGIVGGLIPAEEFDTYIEAIHTFAAICREHDESDVVALFLTSQAGHIGRTAEELRKIM